MHDGAGALGPNCFPEGICVKDVDVSRDRALAQPPHEMAARESAGACDENPSAQSWGRLDALGRGHATTVVGAAPGAG